MSSRDYYKQNREPLPPIRDVLRDQFGYSSRDRDSPYSFDGLNRALPSATDTTRSRSTWPQTSGPTLAPIHAHDGYTSTGPTTPYSSSHSHPHSHSHRSSTPAPSSASASAQPDAGGYSFDVFRPTSSGLVHASSSTRSQGILRTTRADAGKRHNPPPSPEDDDYDGESKRYVCTHCGKRFSRPSSLKTHEIVHSNEKPYECSYPGCGKTFTVPSNMRRHYRKMHEGHAGSGDDEGDDYTHDSHAYQHASSSSASRYSSARTGGSTSTSAGYYSSSRR